MRASTPTGYSDPQAYRIVQAVCRRHAKTFYFASTFLPKERRAAAFAVYAFCRALDDAVDTPDVSDSTANQKLKQFRERLARVFELRLELPSVADRSPEEHALHAFANTVACYELPRQPFEDIATGCEMDLIIHGYADWPALKTYCNRVAGSVGLIMCPILGLQNVDASTNAVALGNAMQLTNILRDLKEDFSSGRVYLPADEMAAFNYTPAQLAEGVINNGFIELMRFQINRARELYRHGTAGLRWLPDNGSRFTAATMATIYGGILDQIERQGYDVFSCRARLSLLRKLSRLPSALRLCHG